MEYFVLCRRVVRHAIPASTQDRFAPRHDNREGWTVSGPFTHAARAERAAAAALATHTCLAAQVVSTAQAEAIIEASSFDVTDESLRRAAAHAVKYLITP